MFLSASKDGSSARLIAILENLPLTPWWWLARRRERERRGLVRHVRTYY